MRHRILFEVILHELMAFNDFDMPIWIELELFDECAVENVFASLEFSWYICRFNYLLRHILILVRIVNCIHLCLVIELKLRISVLY